MGWWQQKDDTFGLVISGHLLCFAAQGMAPAAGRELRTGPISWACCWKPVKTLDTLQTCKHIQQLHEFEQLWWNMFVVSIWLIRQHFAIIHIGPENSNLKSHFWWQNLVFVGNYILHLSPPSQVWAMTSGRPAMDLNRGSWWPLPVPSGAQSQ
jgi:hypothetical protein